MVSRQHSDSSASSALSLGLCSSGSAGPSGRSSEARTCRVPDCPNSNYLENATRYCARHRICEEHLRAPSVMIDEKAHRFCQKCSRLHELSMFDSTKHSCRASLDLLKVRHRKKQQKKKQLQQEADEKISKAAAFEEWQAAQQQQMDQYLSLCNLYGSPASIQGEELAATASLAQGSLPPSHANLQELQAHARAQSGQHTTTAVPPSALSTMYTAATLLGYGQARPSSLPPSNHVNNETLMALAPMHSQQQAGVGKLPSEESTPTSSPLSTTPWDQLQPNTVQAAPANSQQQHGIWPSALSAQTAAPHYGGGQAFQDQLALIATLQQAQWQQQQQESMTFLMQVLSNQSHVGSHVASSPALLPSQASTLAKLSSLGMAGRLAGGIHGLNQAQLHAGGIHQLNHAASSPLHASLAQMTDAGPCHSANMSTMPGYVDHGKYEAAYGYVVPNIWNTGSS